MPVPTVYSEASFASYLTSVLDPLVDVLGWDEGDPRVREAVTDALLDYGTSTITTITAAADVRRLRALGRVAIWRAVVQATAGHYAFTDVGQQQFNRQQVNEQARAMLEIAEADARAIGATSDYTVTIAAVRRPHDPYAVTPDDERILL